MDRSLYELLQKLNIESHWYELLKNGVLKATEYDPSSQSFTIHIHFNQQIKPSVFFALIEIKNKLKYNSTFKLTFENQTFDLNYLKSVLTDVILVRYENMAMVKALVDIELTMDEDNFYFHFDSPIQVEKFERFRNEIENIYKFLGVNKKLVYKTKELDHSRAQEEIDNLKRFEIPSSKPKVEFIKKADNIYEIEELVSSENYVSTRGKIFMVEAVERKKLIVTYYITNYKDSIMVKCFESAKLTKEVLTSFKEGMWVEVGGRVGFDTFAKDEVFTANTIKEIEPLEEKRVDEEEEKRVELHVHTKMSNMDAVCDAGDYIKKAASWGHSAIAITDHGVVQAYPDAVKGGKGKDIKVIYGIEFYVVDEYDNHIFNPSDTTLENTTYVSFDLETTGLSSRADEIIEIGAVKHKNGMIIDRFQTFINPHKKLSEFTTNLTSITNEMVESGLELDVAIPKFIEFCKDSILVAHNAVFDYSFIKNAVSKLGLEPITNPIIDTLPISRHMYSEYRSHTLGSIARRYNIDYDEEVAHRADYDAQVLSEVFEVMLNDIVNKKGITKHKDIASMQDPTNFARKRPIHIIALAKNQQGVKDLYGLVSKSHIEFYNEVPVIPRSLLASNRENLILGSSCLNGEVFDTAMTRNYDDLKRVASFYDYLEVQPISNYKHLVDTYTVENIDRIKLIINYIIEAGKELNIPVVATSDCHYVDPNQKVFRDVYISAQAIGGKHHPLYDFRGRIKDNPDQHLRTTREMLDEFDFLEPSLAKEIVVTNTNLISNMIEPVAPLKDGTYSPRIENDKEELTRICWETAHKLYGEELPEIVKARVDKELASIIGNGFAVMYYIAHKLVKKSNEDGYIVGSRGSVGSSLVAHFTGITEVNALPPHYICDNCKYFELVDPKEYRSGYDLPDKICPKCGKPLRGEGQDIPFETFLGFKGDKVPDIDLNFSGEYQPTAHDFTKVMFGEYNVYRAGTIGTVAQKTAYGYVKGYFEDKGTIDKIRKAEIQRIAMGCEGVKRTTGQHPGGIIVIPNYMDVHDFTPVQYPADDMDASWRTTHFDFHAIHDNVLKLDILGHVDPTALRMLKDITGIEPKDIPCNDKQVFSLFTSCDAMGVTKEQILNENGVVGIPEFGTNFVRKMVLEAHPTTFADLIQISGLSHGTDVWNGNAQTLIQNGTCKLNEVIGCRDDIMNVLIQYGLEPSLAFKIMESVRKGKGLSAEWEQEMINNNVPDWYLESCKKIKYMFPKAHAVAYVTMAIRIAWFKVHMPLEYYATYFSTRCDAFDVETFVKGYDAIKEKFLSIQNRLANFETAKDVTSKEQSLLTTLESAIEMTARGYSFTNIDLYKSDATRFVVDKENKKLIPPFIALDGLGANVAISVVEARKNGEFLSIEDLANRTQLNGTIIKNLQNMGVIKLQERNQLSLDLFG